MKIRQYLPELSKKWKWHVFLWPTVYVLLWCPWSFFCSCLSFSCDITHITTHLQLS